MQWRVQTMLAEPTDKAEWASGRKEQKKKKGRTKEERKEEETEGIQDGDVLLRAVKYSQLGHHLNPRCKPDKSTSRWHRTGQGKAEAR